MLQSKLTDNQSLLIGGKLHFQPYYEVDDDDGIWVCILLMMLIMMLIWREHRHSPSVAIPV
jgi:hypothetical protein